MSNKLDYEAETISTYLKESTHETLRFLTSILYTTWLKSGAIKDCDEFVERCKKIEKYIWNIVKEED